MPFGRDIFVINMSFPTIISYACNVKSKHSEILSQSCHALHGSQKRTIFNMFGIASAYFVCVSTRLVTS